MKENLFQTVYDLSDLNENIKQLPISRLGESVACQFLAENGYIILERNFRIKGGEVDIIAENMGELVFVEVKTRRKGSFDGFEAIDNLKISRIKKCADVFLEKNDKGIWRGIRFDVVLVLVKQSKIKVYLIKDAFF